MKNIFVNSNVIKFLHKSEFNSHLKPACGITGDAGLLEMRDYWRCGITVDAFWFSIVNIVGLPRRTRYKTRTPVSEMMLKINVSDI